MSKHTHNRPLRSSLGMAIALVLAPAAWADPAPTPDTTAAGPAVQLDSVQVRGEFIPEPMAQTSEVASFVTREDLERTGDSDAAQALGRVSGLSLVGGKFVYVRGLGERYSSALFNGSPVPSPEPLQRVIPLDLFPSEVLESVTVQKTYSVRYPGEFGGGVIDMRSLTVPDTGYFKFSIGGGGNSNTTGEKGLTYYGDDNDWWGYDDGARKMSPELRDAIASGNRVDLGANFDREAIRTIGRSINDPNMYVLQEKDSINPDFDFGASAGNSMEIQDGVRLGFVAVAKFENEWRTRTGVQQDPYFTNNSAEYNSSYDFASTRNNARVNAMFGTGLKSERHEVGFTTLYVHDTVKEARSRAGIDNLAGFPVREDHTEWFEREMVSNQLVGKHLFGEFNDFSVEWRAASSKATRDAPYETSISYENVDGYWAHDASRVQNSIRFGKVEDTMDSAGVDLTWRLPTEREMLLSGGLSWLDNDRSAWQREFRFLALDGSLPHYNRYQRPDYLFSDYNLSQDLLRLRETTGNTGAAAYDANLEVRAAYLQWEGEIVPMLRGSFGLRYEDAKQSVNPYDLFTGLAVDAPLPLENDYLLPAATLTWNFSDNQQIRFGVSETIARPQFREMAPQQYNDPDNDRQYYGNPFLVDSKLRNYDVRYEWFFGAGEYVSAGVFYKDIDRPIESNVNEAGGTVFQSFVNAPSATVYGVELDAKKYFDLPTNANWWGDKRLYLSGNYTWSDSEVKAKAGDTVHPFGYATPIDARLFIPNGSQLQGQSEHIANLQVGVESADESLQATLVANYVSERILARGRPGQPDYMEKPGVTLDLVLRKGVNLWNYRTTLAFSARNLLDTDHEEYQEGLGQKIDVYSYERGVSYDASVTIAF